MRFTFSALAASAAIVGAQSTTSINIAAISVPVPTEVFVLPVVYVTEIGAPVQTATTLTGTATASSDAQATNIFDSSADVSAAISSASDLGIATPTPNSRVKRDVCVAQPLGINYKTLPDTAAAFAADAYYGLQAIGAAAPTGYIQTMSNLTASNSANQYMGYTLLQTYDVASCTNQCNAISGCNSVNIYFERDPTVNPDGAACQNPASTINIKCVFWGGAISAANANNFGQWRGSFQVLIAGSNGYMKSSYAAQLAAQATATSSSSATPSATDAAGNIYTFYFGYDSTQGAFANAQASSSYTDCMTACDATSGCAAFTYVGGTNGVGSGTCWLKSTLGSPSSSGSNVISGFRSGKAVSSSSSSVVSTSSVLVSSSTSSTLSRSTSSAVSSSSSSSVVTSSSISSALSRTSSTISSSSKIFSSSVSSSASITSSATSSKVSSSATSSAISSSSTSTSSAPAPSKTPTIAITSGDSDSWLSVAPGKNGVTSWTFSQSDAFRFSLNSRGNLLEAQGASTGFAATWGPAANGNTNGYNLRQMYFNPAGVPGSNYLTCSQDPSTMRLNCFINGMLQQAYVCPDENDNWNNIFLVDNNDWWSITNEACGAISGFFYAN